MRSRTLGEAALDLAPLGARDDPRDEVEGEGPVLGGGAVRIDDRERNPLLAKDLVAATAQIDHCQPAHRVERRDEAGCVVARRPG
jgi:hypothetical protein